MHVLPLRQEGFARTQRQLAEETLRCIPLQMHALSISWCNSFEFTASVSSGADLFNHVNRAGNLAECKHLRRQLEHRHGLPGALHRPKKVAYVSIFRSCCRGQDSGQPDGGWPLDKRQPWAVVALAGVRLLGGRVFFYGRLHFRAYQGSSRTSSQPDFGFVHRWRSACRYGSRSCLERVDHWDLVLERKLPLRLPGTGRKPSQPEDLLLGWLPTMGHNGCSWGWSGSRTTTTAATWRRCRYLQILLVRRGHLCLQTMQP